MLNWFRRRTPIAAPIAGDFTPTLRKNVWQYRWLDDAQRDRVHEVVALMLAERRWEGAGGLAITDEIQATIAGVAALLTLGYDEPYAFDKLTSIVVYPAAYKAERSTGGGWLDLAPGAEWTQSGDARLGEAWGRGPVVLSWRDTLRSARRPQRGDNLVLHELAHHVDALDGEADGTPILRGELRRRWAAVVDREYTRLVGQARRSDVTLLDHYGATNRAEFFAIATECFFERPHEMKARHAELFDLLAEFYRQDPTGWLPPPNRWSARRDAAMREAPGRLDVSGLGLSPSDQLFTAGHELLAAGEPERAVEAFDRLLANQSDDAEALVLRAAARLELGDYERARDDALAAIEHEPGDPVAHAAAAEALLELDEDQAAMRHAKACCRADSKNPDGWLFRGMLDLRAGRLGRAIKSLRRAAGLDPYDADTQYWLGCAYEQSGDARAAERAFDRAALLEGEDKPDRDAPDG